MIRDSGLLLWATLYMYKCCYLATELYLSLLADVAVTELHFFLSSDGDIQPSCSRIFKFYPVHLPIKT